MRFWELMIIFSSVFLFLGIYSDNDRLANPMFILLLISVATLDILKSIEKAFKEKKGTTK